MKKYIYTLELVAILIITVNAQSQNTIPPLKIDIQNGWYKFVEQGTAFDVEIKENRLVKGNVVWFDQSKYSGSLSKHSISGKGTYTWANGQRYEGSFKSNQRHGWGHMYYVDGTVYNGKWKANRKHGKGTLYAKDGSVIKSGYWVEDQYVGEKKKKKGKAKK